MRSWLQVSADDEDRLAQIAGLATDAVILDLAGILPDTRSRARARAREWLEAHRTQVIAQQQQSRWVQISPLGSRWWRDDLQAVLHSAPDGIVLPRCSAPDQLQALTAELYENEQREGLSHNAVRILPLLGSTAASAFTTAEFATGANPRLAGFGWNAASLAKSLGATRVTDETGSLATPLRLVRAQVLMAARARGVMPIESPLAQDAGEETFAAQAQAARQDGFEGMIATHPDQIPILNEIFSVTEHERGEARSIVAAFSENSGGETAEVSGRIIDRSDLARAERIMQRSGPPGGRTGTSHRLM
ncbi:CoA ester lyase [Altererythrobacter aquiaggeris]|uniref:HpcH/HpaI aldolase/citrate lyase family protein n=1 Tax=Aestuarierythrobacter aquiaggeris TaxID=1898396 RepID=UPI003019D075